MQDPSDVKLIGCDLDTPDYPRQSSRFLVFVGQCAKCNCPVTSGHSFASYSVTGEQKIKTMAEINVLAMLSEQIDWERITTTKTEFKSLVNSN